MGRSATQASASSSVELAFPLRGPGGEPVDLRRTIDSHGFSDLPPLRLDETSGSLEATLPVRRGRPRRVHIRPARRSHGVVEVAGPPPGEATRTDLLDGVRHILRMDQDLAPFYALVRSDPDLAWAASGAGRMLRSPTVFEDVVKTICTTNCAWSGTRRMVDAIVTHLGTPAAGTAAEGPYGRSFPDPAAMAAAGEDFYRGTARAGYRGAYLIQLARSVAEGAIDLEAWGRARPDELPDDELELLLLALPGVGPYAAAHIMMTLGRYSRLILDSWTRPTYARVAGHRRVVKDATIQRRFRSYGPYAGLAFWLFCTRDWVPEPGA
ncbi:MAG: Fe-S cluster assembly protein HesB [Actinomycetota bacterium]